MRPQILRSLVVDKLREAVVNLVCHLIVHLALQQVSAHTSDVPVRSLWVEHGTEERVVSRLDRHRKVYPFISFSQVVGCEQLVEILEWTVVEGIDGDDPVVGLEKNLPLFHFFQ